MLGPTQPTVREIIDAMRVSAGHFKDSRLLLILTGTQTSISSRTLFVEEREGLVGVSRLGPRLVSDRIFEFLSAFDLGTQAEIYEGMDRFGRGGRRVYPRYEGQIELFVSGDEFSIEVFHHDTIPEELLPTPLRDVTRKEGEEHYIRRTILLSEKYFGPTRLVVTDYYLPPDRPPGWPLPDRFDLRTAEPDPWPDPPGPPPWDGRND